MPIDFNTIIKNMLDISTIDNRRYVAPWRQTRWLIGSSCFFLIPSTYGFIKGKYFLANVALLTSACSINYWRDANYSWRRTADLIMAKVTTVIYVTNGVMYVTKTPYTIYGYSGLFGLSYCYYMSHKHEDSEKWWKYHMMFHFIVSCVQTLTLKCMVNYESAITNILSII
jgi:hypothetical protein